MLPLERLELSNREEGGGWQNKSGDSTVQSWNPKSSQKTAACAGGTE